MSKTHKMKHLLLIITMAFASASFSEYAIMTKARGITTVYVCVSTTSSRYHTSEHCSGLNKCTHEIKGMSIADAQKMGKTPCHICNPPLK